ncbi:unnamed protein product [Schistosoma mattheei]|uniref:Uncharacterized protein n=2 Tax=Schistosoma TaxID=6181 RepID=A0A183KTM4_9TREM|nr:unnamed protein product [Schistosoma mattheei]VDP65741.1 unnamed protein product [Schistosoma curassoni]
MLKTQSAQRSMKYISVQPRILLTHYVLSYLLQKRKNVGA